MLGARRQLTGLPSLKAALVLFFCEARLTLLPPGFLTRSLLQLTVHNLLALNSVLDPHLSKLWRGDLKNDMKRELNITPPPTKQGQEGAFAGPECDKFLNNLDVFKERFMVREQLKMFYSFFLAFKQLKDGTFGAVL